MRRWPFLACELRNALVQFDNFLDRLSLKDFNRNERLMANSVNDGTKKTPGAVLWRPFPEMPKWQREMERMFADFAKTICPPHVTCGAGNRDAATERRKTAIIKIAK